MRYALFMYISNILVHTIIHLFQSSVEKNKTIETINRICNGFTGYNGNCIGFVMETLMDPVGLYW